MIQLYGPNVKSSTGVCVKNDRNKCGAYNFWVVIFYDFYEKWLIDKSFDSKCFCTWWKVFFFLYLRLPDKTFPCKCLSSDSLPFPSFSILLDMRPPNLGRDRQIRARISPSGIAVCYLWQGKHSTFVSGNVSLVFSRSSLPWRKEERICCWRVSLSTWRETLGNFTYQFQNCV